MGKGHISTGIIYGMGVDAPGWLEIDPQNIFDSDSAGIVQSLEIKYGLQDDLDAAIRVSAHEAGSAGKLLLKKELHQHDRFTSAVVFGGGIVSGREDYWRDGSDNGQDYRFQLLSAEAQLLATKDFPRNIFLTLAARGNYHQFERKLYGAETLREQFHHAGARMNIGRTYGGFTMIFELGVEVPLSAGDIDQVYPWGGYKMAWEWSSKHKK
jgi:hypothetical protein